VLSSYNRKKGRRERRLRGKLSLTLLKPSNYIEELKPRRKGKKIYEATLLHSHLPSVFSTPCTKEFSFMFQVAEFFPFSTQIDDHLIS